MDFFYYCDTNYRASLISALIHLDLLTADQLTLKEVMKLPWWEETAKLKPGDFFQIGTDQKGHKVFIISVDKDKKLLPKITQSILKEFGLKDRKVIQIDSLSSAGVLVSLGKNLRLIPGLKLFADYLILTGIVNSYKKALIRKDVNLTRGR